MQSNPSFNFMGEVGKKLTNKTWKYFCRVTYWAPLEVLALGACPLAKWYYNIKVHEVFEGLYIFIDNGITNLDPNSASLIISTKFDQEFNEKDPKPFFFPKLTCKLCTHLAYTWASYHIQTCIESFLKWHKQCEDNDHYSSSKITLKMKIVKSYFWLA